MDAGQAPKRRGEQRQGPWLGPDRRTRGGAVSGAGGGKPPTRERSATEEVESGGHVDVVRVRVGHRRGAGAGVGLGVWGEQLRRDRRSRCERGGVPWWVIPGGGSCRGARGGVRLWGSVGLGLGGVWVGARTVVDIAGRWMGWVFSLYCNFLGGFFHSPQWCNGNIDAFHGDQCGSALVVP